MKKLIYLVFIFLPYILFSQTNDKNYFQQEVDYKINVTLDTKNHTLTGKEILVYKNNSPDNLSFVWFHAYPNAYKNKNTNFAKELYAEGSTQFEFSTEKERGYMDIKYIKVNGTDTKWEYKEDDITEIKVFLPQEIKSGESVTFEIEFFVKLPNIFSRLGHNGRHYEITQWYPKIVVYDKKGWYPDGYHYIGEFYGDFGKFDVTITLPKDLIIDATGNLINLEEIAFMDSLAKEGEKIYQMAEKERKKYLSERTKRINSLINDSLYKTVQFKAEDVHDFAWFADPHYIVRESSYENIKTRIMFLPKNESNWRNSLEYLNDALKYFGNWYGKYPCSKMTAVDGDISAGGGMEYPNITIVNSGSPNWSRLMEQVIVHETSHQWFYGILGSNEMDEAWLDEGITRYNDVKYMEKKYGKNSGNMLNAPPFWLRLFVTEELVSFRNLENVIYFYSAIQNFDEPILKPAYKFREGGNYALVYSKTGWIIDMLNYLVGEEKFDKIMKTYFEKWKFKHPTTEDFIAVAEEQSGMELDWFFDQWLKTTHKLDYAIDNIKNEKQDNKFITTVTIVRKGEITMPVDVLLVTSNGDSVIKRYDGKALKGEIVFENSSKYKYITLDPNKRLLDINPLNNYSLLKVYSSFLFDIPNIYAYQIFYNPIIWYNSRDKLRIGGRIHGEQLLHGKYFFTMKGVYVPISESGKKFNFELNFGSTLNLFSNNTKYTLSYSDDFGRRYARLDFDLFWSKYLDRRYSHKLNIRPNWQDIYDTQYYSSGVFSKDKMTSIRFEYEYSIRGTKYRSYTNFAVKYGIKTLGNNYGMSKYYIDSIHNFTWTKSFSTRFHIFAGTTSGSAPNQERFYLARSVNPEFTDKFQIDTKGNFSSLEHWQTGIMGLRGYYGIGYTKSGYAKNEYPNGRSALIFNVDITVPKIPFKLFFDAGDTWRETNLAFKYSAGLGLDIGPLKAYFPIWISDPRDGEKNFGFRWLISANFGISLPWFEM